MENYKSTTGYPDEVCEIMARYQWGGLRHTTPKEFRDLKKRQRKRQASSSLRSNETLVYCETCAFKCML
jgi:hypothetical protein